MLPPVRSTRWLGCAIVIVGTPTEQLPDCRQWNDQKHRGQRRDECCENPAGDHRKRALRGSEWVK